MPAYSSAEVRQRIEVLLSEPVEVAANRELETFPALLKETDGTIVLFGAGRMGRICARALGRGGIAIRAFCDGNPAHHGSRIEGAIVMAPDEAARRYGGSSMFVVSIWTGTAHESMLERMDYLRVKGCLHVTSHVPLLWAFGREEIPIHSFDLPSSILGNARALIALSRLLLDEASLVTLESVLRQRLLGEFDRRPPVSDQYFPPDVIELREEEVFVDGGAFTGDTLAAFLKHTASKFLEDHAV